MKISKDIWNFKEENFGPLLPYIKDSNITDINYNGTDVWVEDLSKGVYKTPVELSEEFVNQFCVRISNVVSEQFNKANNVLEAETDVLRISIIHPSVTNTGCAISIRKTPAVRRLTEEKMIDEHYCSREILTLLKNCIRAKFCFLWNTGCRKN